MLSSARKPAAQAAVEGMLCKQEHTITCVRHARVARNLLSSCCGPCGEVKQATCARRNPEAVKKELSRP